MSHTKPLPKDDYVPVPVVYQPGIGGDVRLSIPGVDCDVRLSIFDLYALNKGWNCISTKTNDPIPYFSQSFTVFLSASSL